MEQMSWFHFVDVFVADVDEIELDCQAESVCNPSKLSLDSFPSQKPLDLLL